MLKRFEKREFSLDANRSDSQNFPYLTFLNFPLNEFEHSSDLYSATAPCATVQWRCNPFQKIALCEMDDHLTQFTARLGCRFVYATSLFARKKDANLVDGRG